MNDKNLKSEHELESKEVPLQQSDMVEVLQSEVPVYSSPPSGFTWAVRGCRS